MGDGTYRLDGLVRGQYNTTPAAHGANHMLVRCDAALLHAPFAKEDIGKTLWLKFCSYNIFGAGEQSLADVQAYEYTLQPYYVPPVRQLTARNRYRQLRDGVVRYDIVVEWAQPDLQSYLEGRVWYKTNAAQSKYLNFAQGVNVNELGFSGEWVYGGSGKKSAVIPQAVVGDTYRIAITTVDIWGVETSPDASPQQDIRVALRTEIPNTPDGFRISFGKDAVASWKEVVNSDIAWYEVRKDQAPGEENVNLLARVTGLKATLPITERTGILYLYAYSAAGKYSAPAILEYNKPIPPTPAAPYVKAKLSGFALEAGAIPSGCDGMNIYIDGADLVEVHTVNNVYSHSCDAGIYDISVSYTDMFGEGLHSPETRVTIKATVDAALLEQQAVTKEKLSLALQASVDTAAQTALDLASLAQTVNGNGTAITNNSNNITALAARTTDTESDISALQIRANSIESTVSNLVVQGDVTQAAFSSIQQNADSIAAIVGNLNSNTGVRNYTALQVMQDGLASKVTQNDVSSWFQQDHTGFYIKGSLIDIDGTTRIGNNIITRNMIQSAAISADKIAVDSLSAISAVIGVLRTATSGARLEVRSNQILVYDANNKLRVRMGVW